MGDTTYSLSEEGAKRLVEFVKSTNGEYVIVLPARVGVTPYLRPTEYGGFLVRSLDDRTGVATETHRTEKDVVDDLEGSKMVLTEHFSVTPREAWGTVYGTDGEDEGL